MLRCDTTTATALAHERDIAVASRATASSRRPFMQADDVKARLHDALHRHPKATEEEVDAIAVVVLAIVGEVTAELAVLIGELAARVEALEAKA
jgi:hypothetical protein